MESFCQLSTALKSSDHIWTSTLYFSGSCSLTKNFCFRNDTSWIPAVEYTRDPNFDIIATLNNTEQNHGKRIYFDPSKYPVDSDQLTKTSGMEKIFKELLQSAHQSGHNIIKNGGSSKKRGQTVIILCACRRTKPVCDDNETKQPKVCREQTNTADYRNQRKDGKKQPRRTGQMTGFDNEGCPWHIKLHVDQFGIYISCTNSKPCVHRGHMHIGPTTNRVPSKLMDDKKREVIQTLARAGTSGAVSRNYLYQSTECYFTVSQARYAAKKQGQTATKQKGDSGKEAPDGRSSFDKVIEIFKEYNLVYSLLVQGIPTQPTQSINDEEGLVVSLSALETCGIEIQLDLLPFDYPTPPSLRCKNYTQAEIETAFRVAGDMVVFDSGSLSTNAIPAGLTQLSSFDNDAAEDFPFGDDSDDEFPPAQEGRELTPYEYCMPIVKEYLEMMNKNSTQEELEDFHSMVASRLTKKRKQLHEEAGKKTGHYISCTGAFNKNKRHHGTSYRNR